MAAASTTNRSPPNMVVPPIISTGGSERTPVGQGKSVSISGMTADVGSRSTAAPADNRSLAREPHRIRINAQNNGFSSERERMILMRTISHLRKEEILTDKQQKSTPATQRHVPDEEDDDEQSARPFHHSELASPPCYSNNNRSGFSRLSLDVRRSRAMSASDSSPYGDPPHSGNGTSNDRRWFSRSQFDLSTPIAGNREAGDNSPTSPRFTPQAGTLTDGVLQAKARVAAMASAKLRRFSFANLPKMNSKKSGNVSVQKDIHQSSIEKGKQRAMPIEQISVTDVEPQNGDIRIATHDANSDVSISALESAESGVPFARPEEDETRRDSDAPSSFSSTEPSTSSEDGASSVQSSMNPSRQNSETRPSIAQSTSATSANEHSPQISASSNGSDEIAEDDGIQWATPSESVHNQINPFDKKKQLTKADNGE
ncbi:uncharacterized protein FA14DRAFT_156644 [Meira miltonrushii]|uniref:Uncharacterized protein n=1 Tax=Meira miltonrushii TaxID=1280837 RepID=A0A316VA72_9BASI|nr:uncharacterized protein FA14DRAFT_156644 [Meira miltonrushii]PWN33968.1 hypothetical protein FA14DRAFT_156644 [Meira miltonrushii]